MNRGGNADKSCRCVIDILAVNIFVIFFLKYSVHNFIGRSV